MKSAAAPLRDTLRDCTRTLSATSHDGKVADYIPELAKADPELVRHLRRHRRRPGLTRSATASSSFTHPVDLQAVRLSAWRSKTTAATQCCTKVGVEPTGEAFNSIVLDEASNRPFNPMVNAGAIATADLIQGKDFADRVKPAAGHVRPLRRPRRLHRQRGLHVRARPPATATARSPI